MSGRVYKTEHPTVRFWRMVDKENFLPCWKWTGAGCKRGYGRFRPGPSGVPMVGAHRFSFEQYGGVVGDGQVVMHSCDNPWCVNPDHLSAGSNKQNTADAMRKGRMKKLLSPGHDPRRGRGPVKLDSDKVLAIRNSSLPYATLSRIYGVDPTLIARIKQNKAWMNE